MKKIIHLILAVALLGASTANASVLVYSPLGNLPGVKLDLATAATAVDCVGKTIHLTAPVTLAADLVWPSDRKLVIDKGGVINGSGKTITFAPGTFEAGKHQVFGVGLIVKGLARAFPEWWTTNAVPDVTDMVYATEAAMAVDHGIEVVITTSMHWSRALNMSNFYGTFVGVGGFIGVSSASTNYIIDATSVNYGAIRNLSFSSTTAKVGIYLNRSSTVNYTQYFTMDKVFITLGSDPTANSSRGTIAYYNRSAELNNVNDCTFVSDCPAVMIRDTEVSLPPLFVTVGSNNSMTATAFSKCRFIALTASNYCMMLTNVGGIDFTGCYWSISNNAIGANTIAIYANNVVRCRFDGQVEQWPQFMAVYGIVRQCKVHIATPQGSAGGFFVLKDTSPIATFTDNEINMDIAGTAPSNSSVVYSAYGNAHFACSGNTINAGGQPNVQAVYFPNAPGAIQEGYVRQNTENVYSGMRVNNIKQYFGLGGFVSNDTSYVYMIPANVAMVEITATYLTQTGSANSNSYKLVLGSWQGGHGHLTFMNIGTTGANNTLSQSLGADRITFIQANNTGSELVGYAITEYYGDAQ